MANFVLVAGARLGAWAWTDVVPHLRAGGHGVHPLTLSGLADKRGLPAGQQTHVRDVVDEVEGNDLRDVVLVGRLVEMDTGHWPMFSQPRELAQTLLDASAK